MASLFDDKWTGIIFQGRNQDYGAFELRRNSARNALIAMGIALTVSTLLISAPVIAKFFMGEEEDTLVKVTEVDALAAPPPIDPNEPPPPPVEPPPPLKTTIKFTPPVIVKDEEVTEADEPPPQVEDDTATSGATTQIGDPTGVDDVLPTPTGPSVIDEGPEEIRTFVEQMPEFPGGQAALLKYIAEHTNYPDVARENDIEGTVFVKFVVDKEGRVGQAQVIKSIDKYLDKEALRVVSALPAFKPGKQNGKAVPVYFTVPIKFTLK
ncbi:MAG: energy transducer TonB [Chitinophagales bacterium]|nr:energy transducer TonB [Chitinophagales bacterium]